MPRASIQESDKKNLVEMQKSKRLDWQWADP